MPADFAWSLLRADPALPRPERLYLAAVPSVRGSGGIVRNPYHCTEDQQDLQPGGLCCPAIFGPLRPGATLAARLQATHEGRPDGTQLFVPHSPYDRFGTIRLPVPVLHPWLSTRDLPRLRQLTGQPEKVIEALLGCELAVDSETGQVLDEEAMAGARGELLWGADALAALGVPQCYLIRDLAVLPPGLRSHLVVSEDGRIRTSDVNVLYRVAVNRQNRLARLLELGAPEIIVRNERRMLQLAVEQLFDNDLCREPQRGSEEAPAEQPYRSLTAWMGASETDVLKAFLWLDEVVAKDGAAIDGPLPGVVYWALLHARALHLDVVATEPCEGQARYQLDARVRYASDVVDAAFAESEVVQVYHSLTLDPHIDTFIISARDDAQRRYILLTYGLSTVPLCAGSGTGCFELATLVEGNEDVAFQVAAALNGLAHALIELDLPVSVTTALRDRDEIVRGSSFSGFALAGPIDVPWAAALSRDLPGNPQIWRVVAATAEEMVIAKAAGLPLGPTLLEQGVDGVDPQRSSVL